MSTSNNQKKPSRKQIKPQSAGEEIANSVTHGIGAALSVAALVLLVVFASIRGDAWRVVSFSVYGSALICLYLASTLYHAFRNERVKRFFKLMDHSSIYLLIAGTYTPITLTVMRGPWGWTLFGIIWGLAVAGVIFKLIFIGRFRIISVIIYIAMSWLIIIAFKPMVSMVPAGMITWLFIGGACYMLGVVFYVWRIFPYHHAIWHLFVLGGSISHFFGILFHIA
ncbi:MAG: hemolysin III family protein [Candidatus Electryonea clarkiae]|nr:hemolysin III family protein [Candidatus Electryonea clarkiae]MDP8287697.1 hemolysin III family protein [Candidatus Electryonea clarkiae]